MPTAFLPTRMPPLSKLCCREIEISNCIWWLGTMICTTAKNFIYIYGLVMELCNQLYNSVRVLEYGLRLALKSEKRTILTLYEIL